MSFLDPWSEAEQSRCSDQLKRFVYQNEEERRASSLPHVVKQLPKQRTVQGYDSPHQTGDHLAYDMLIRGPLYQMTSHFTEVAPQAPVRGVHRHVSAPALFCMRGKGWEMNDGRTFEFRSYDLLVIPPYAVHQHGGDRDVGCEIYVPEAFRTDHLLGLNWREQHKLSEKPVFPAGTEPLTDDAGKVIGYRIKKGVLGITEDIEVVLGAEASREATFQARRQAGNWNYPVENTYDRYVKLLHDEADFCRKVTHVVQDEHEPWEWTPQGKIKWMVHPLQEIAAKVMWIYFQEIPPGSRSGKHRHVSEELLLVLEGRGFDVHDGQRWEWEQGDLICVPPMTEHQHFGLGENRALLLSAMPSIYADFGFGGIEQLDAAPEHAGL
jgi:quercetin dioxygenase-like cupin family protein